jgi:predicted nucleic acid-binding protein
MIAYVDTNVLVRFITGQPLDLYEKSVALMKTVEEGDVTLRVDEIIAAEVVWVLKSVYKFTAQEIAAACLEILTHDGIVVSDVVISALALFGSQGISFRDALLAARMRQTGVTRVFSFDKHFDRIPGIERLEPGAMSASAED